MVNTATRSVKISRVLKDCDVISNQGWCKWSVPRHLTRVRWYRPGKKRQEIFNKYVIQPNRSEFTAKKGCGFIPRMEIKSLFFDPGNAWENGYIGSFNGKMRDDFFTGEIFHLSIEAQGFLQQWSWHYDQIRPHSTLEYNSPTPAAVIILTSQLQLAGVP